MKTLFRSSRWLLTLPVLAGLVAAGPVSADPPPPPMTVHQGDSGIVTDPITDGVQYVGGGGGALFSEFGGRQLDASIVEQPPELGGVVRPHGPIRASARLETNREDYLYLNLAPSVNVSAVSADTGNESDRFSRIHLVPFDKMYFTTTEPLQYGIESEIAGTQTNSTGSGVAQFVELALADPGPEGGLARRIAFGSYHDFHHLLPLLASGQINGGVVYEKIDRNGTANDVTGGTPNGVLLPGHYSVGAALEFYFANSFPNAQAPQPEFITGAMNLTSNGEVWVIVGKAAGWKRSQDGDYTAAAPWIAQHEPLPDYHVFFKRPNAAYSVSGITGTVRSFTFAGGEQQVTLAGGTAEATNEILVADDTVILQGTTLNTPIVKIQAANANLIVKNGGKLRADPSTTGEIKVGSELNHPRGRLTVEEGGQARAGIVTLGSFSGGGGGDVNAVSEVTDKSRDAAMSKPPLSDSPVAAALTVNDTGADITGTVHVGSDAYGSGAELAVAQRLHVLGSAKLESVSGVVDNTSDPDAMKLQGGQWTNSDDITIGKSHDATVQVINGGKIDTESLVIGKNAGGHGTVNAQSSVTALITTVGDSGEGNLLGSNSANLQLGALVIGHNAGSHGTVMIQSGTTLTTESTVVGDSGRAVLTVSGNSNVSAQALNIAQKAGSIGSMFVSDSTLTVENLGGVGKGGSGLLDLSSASVLQGSGVLDIGEHGTVKLRQGTAASGFGFNIDRGGRLEVTDGASFVGDGNGFICQNNGSVLFSNSQGNSINASFTIESTDAVVTNGSTIDVLLDAIISPTGVLTVSGAGTRVTVGNSMVVRGALVISAGAVVEGASDMAELALGPNAYVSGSGGSLQFKNITNPYGIARPGNSPGTMTLDGDYAQGPGGMIEIEIGGTTPGVDYDQLIVTGDATINGIILVKFINGYTPTAGQQFNIIDTGGNFTGSPRVIVQGLADGWQFTTGFDVLSGEFRINSTSNGVAGTPPGNDINNLDGDADTNFMEFAFGTDPAVSDSGVMQVTGNTMIRRGSPIVSLTNTPTGVDYRAVFCQRKDKASLGLTYTVQFSADLTTWQDSAATPTLVADDGDYEAVSVRYPFFVNGKKARFFRVSISTP